MLSLDNSSILEQTQNIERFMKENPASAALMFDAFLQKSLASVYKDVESTFPREIRIPKPLHAMLEGDLEPARIIRLEKPLYYKEAPIWCGDSTEGIYLRGLGYKNGDSRYPASQKLDNNDIHMILGGATGHGKSVTLNSIVFGICMEYPPWEVRLVMVDAKVAEFKKYGVNHIIPHISSIAATTDADYMISVLEDLKREMELRNELFGMYGLSDINGFRKKTKLALPRVYIPFDEFQTALVNAGRRESVISDLIDAYARLGRSTGFHLGLASQEPGGIGDKTMNNIGVRAALGCMSNVSEKLLKNDEAKINFGIKGRIVVNPNPANGSKLDNVHYRVPFQTDDMFDVQMEFLSNLGDEIGYRENLSFYDENAKVREKDFPSMLSTKRVSANRIYLGEPSFVLRDPEGDNIVRIELTGNDIENIMVFCSSVDKVERYLKMLFYNFKQCTETVHHNVMSPDPNLVDKIGLKNLTTNIYDVRSSTDPNFTGFYVSIYRRLLCLDIDKLVFQKMQITEQSDKVFYEMFDRGSQHDTEFNRARVFAAFALLQDPANRSGFDLPEFKGQVTEKEIEIVKSCIMQAHVSGCSNRQLTYDKFSPIFNWVVGLDRVLGIGRDSKMNLVEKFKKVLQDCTRANVRYIISATDPENLTGIRSGIRFLLMEGLTEAQARKMGCETYPEMVAAPLGILMDKYGPNKDCVKFKKMFFDNEIVS